jgi:anti-sigma B factor antagonist
LDYGFRVMTREEIVDERLPWAHVLAVYCELDIGSAAWFADAIEDRLRQELPLIVDLSDCPYLDSTILNVLIRASNAEPGRVGIVVPAGTRIRRIFSIAGLEEPLQICETRDALQVRFSG